MCSLCAVLVYCMLFAPCAVCCTRVLRAVLCAAPGVLRHVIGVVFYAVRGAVCC